MKTYGFQTFPLPAAKTAGNNQVKDTQCGFKMFRQSILRPLLEPMHLDGFGFDLEILFLAQKMKFSIKEVPVNWTHVEGSKVHLFEDSLRMFVNILQIRRWHRRGTKVV